MYSNTYKLYIYPATGRYPGFMTDYNEDIPYKTACFNILGYPSRQRKAGKIQRGIPADKWTTGCHGNTGDRTSD